MKGPAHPQASGKKIVGLVGYARTGKDTVADILVKEYGYTRFAFVDKLRECLYALNPIVVNDAPMTNPIDWLDDEFKAERRVQTVIDSFGWDGYKESPWGPEIRRLLQRFGTEVGRELIADDIWLRELDKVDADKIVVTDARFVNEIEYIHALGGVTVRIERPGVGPANDHASEHDWKKTTQRFYINNDGTLDSLAYSVGNLHKLLLSML